MLIYLTHNSIISVFLNPSLTVVLKVDVLQWITACGSSGTISTFILILFIASGSILNETNLQTTARLNCHRNLLINYRKFCDILHPKTIPKATMGTQSDRSQVKMEYTGCKKLGASRACILCKVAPVLVGDTAIAHYYNTLCQQADWSKHKKTCRKLRLRTELHGVTALAQKLFYIWREMIWGQMDVKEAGINGTEINLKVLVRRRISFLSLFRLLSDFWRDLIDC